MIDLFYKCGCMKEEVKLPVPERLNDEPVEDWIEKVRIAVTCAHWILSPLCKETQMEYVKIPFPENAPYLGAKGKLDA